MIDAGHARKGRYRVRSFATHSPVGVWTAFTPLVLFIVVAFLGPSFLKVYARPEDLVVAGLTAYVMHMILDSVTEGGVYLTPSRRVAIAHYSYDGLADVVTFLLSSIFAAMVVGGDILARLDHLVRTLAGVLG